MAICEAVEMHVAQGFQPARTTYLVFGHDEGVMGPEGVRHIVDALKERGVREVALVLDEGLPLTTGLFPGVAAPVALIATAEKGVCHPTVESGGCRGHSAMPPTNSLIRVLAQAITKLEANPLPYRITRAVRDQMRYLGPELPERMHAMLAAVAHGQASQNVIQGTGDDSGYASTPIAGWQTASDLEDQFTKYMLSGPQTTAMLHTTTAVTMVAGGVKENVMPRSPLPR